jgi:rod shape-determining protein MreC
MRRILENKLLTIVIILSIVFVVFIGVTASKRDRVSIFEGVVGNVLSPVQKYLYIGGQRINNLFSFISNISTIKNENDALKAQNIDLENKLVDYDTLKSENQRLKEMLSFKEQYKDGIYTYVGASVIGKGSGNWFDVFIIDKGTNQGIKKYYPVVTGKGLVGQVVDVGPNWAKVLSIVDEKSRVSGIVSRSGDQGMVQGTSDFAGEKNCRMLYLASTSDVQVGDNVVTSELSKFFPKNISIGTVLSVDSEKNDFTKSITIKPSVDFSKLQEVFVITNAIDEKYYPPDEEN